MTRALKGSARHIRRKKVMALVKGHRGRRNNCYRVAKQSAERALQYAYRDRRQRKRTMRALWIMRINAAVRQHGELTYGRMMHGLKLANIDLNRKMLADLCVHEPDSFKSLHDQAKAALAKAIPDNAQLGS
ncbi:MAG: 50S ribosomal protein L20 [Pseudomonadota bacterium]